MLIRTYRPGEEQAQARVYNASAGALPAFKPASPEEIARRYRGDVDDPGTRYYAEVDGEVVGYAVFCESGRISYPWCLPGAEDVREPLLDAVLLEMNRRGMPEAWATYRADWSAVLEFLRVHGFVEKRQMINYLADVSRLPDRAELPEDRVIEPIGRGDVFHLAALAPTLFSSIEPRSLEAFFWENPYYDFSESFFALKDRRDGRILGACLLVLSERFADPSKIDAAMPVLPPRRVRDRARATQARQRAVLLRVRRRIRRGSAALGARLAACTRGGAGPCGGASAIRCDRPVRLLRPHLPAARGVPHPLEDPDGLTARDTNAPAIGERAQTGDRIESSVDGAASRRGTEEIKENRAAGSTGLVR